MCPGRGEVCLPILFIVNLNMKLWVFGCKISSSFSYCARWHLTSNLEDKYSHCSPNQKDFQRVGARRKERGNMNMDDYLSVALIMPLLAFTKATSTLWAGFRDVLGASWKIHDSNDMKDIGFFIESFFLQGTNSLTYLV